MRATHRFSMQNKVAPGNCTQHPPGLRAVMKCKGSVPRHRQCVKGFAGRQQGGAVLAAPAHRHQHSGRQGGASQDGQTRSLEQEHRAMRAVEDAACRKGRGHAHGGYGIGMTRSNSGQSVKRHTMQLGCSIPEPEAAGPLTQQARHAAANPGPQPLEDGLQ